MDKKNAELVQKKVIQYYGTDTQLRILQEECGELIVAISHYLRKRGSIDNLIEEMVDVTNVLEQFTLIMTPEASELFCKIHDKKIKRMANIFGLRLP